MLLQLGLLLILIGEGVNCRLTRLDMLRKKINTTLNHPVVHATLGRIRSKPWLYFMLCGLLFALVLFTRRPTAILHPQFWAEDGPVYYHDAYRSPNLLFLFSSNAGYHTLIVRAVALLSLSVRLSKAPLFFAVAALAINVAPAIYMVSKRMESLIPSKRSRWTLAVVYLALPYTGEVMGNMTNTQWTLAVLGFMLAIVRPAKSKLARWLELLVLLLICLTGPYCFFLAPLALLFWVHDKKRERLYRLLVIAGACLAQLLAFLPTLSLRGAVSPDHTLLNYLKIWEVDIFGATTVGLKHSETMLQSHGLLLALVGIICAGVMAYGFWKGPVVLKAFIGMAVVMFTMSLFTLLKVPGALYWQGFLSAIDGTRYFFFPTLAWAVTVVWLAFQAPRGRLLGKLLLCSMLIFSVIPSWRLTKLPDKNFQTYANKFESLKTGESIVIPLNPEGAQLHMTKH
jgi:hypothetical protein